MSKFFINRPIVAMVISIIMVLIGLVAMVQLPIAQFPELAPPEILLQATYVGADALTLEQSVATPIEQQLQGVDNMIYMTSINSSSGLMRLRVDFDVGTDANTDQILTQMRYLQAESQLPIDVRNQGVTILKSATSPLALFSLYSPKGTYDGTFLANYAYININDPMSRVSGIGQVAIFGADKYAMRFWVRPDTLASLGITVSDIIAALNNQNTVNPAGQIGAEPVPPGQEFTYTVRAQGRLLDAEEFGNIVVRANPDGSIVRMKDVARVELGAQKYNQIGRLNGNPAAIIAIYQLPGSNAIDTMNRAKQLMEDLKQRFPARPRLHDLARHDPRSDRRHQGNRQDAFRSARPGHHCRLYFPAELAGDVDSAAGGAGLTGRHVRHLPVTGLFYQHAVAFWPGARDRSRGRRCDRRGRSGRAAHRAGDVAARCNAQGHGTSIRACGGNRAGPLGGLLTRRLCRRHSRATELSVCRDDCDFDSHFGL